MNNTTIEITSSLINALHISHTIWYLFGFLCPIFGIPGHILIIIIMSNKLNRKQTSSIYFIAIALSEIIYLLGIFWLWCVRMSITSIDRRDILSCGLFYNILIGSTILSNGYLAAYSIDRTKMIIFPARSRLLITRQHVFRCIIFIFILMISFIIPHSYYYYYYDQTTTIFLCEFYRFLDHWKIRIWTFLHAFLFITISHLISFLSAIILLRNRCSHRKRHLNEISTIARRLERNSILILVFSIIILSSLVPFTILQICLIRDRIFQYENLSIKQWRFYQILIDSFLTLTSINYSSKFYFRLLISKVFRDDLRNLFK